MDIYVAREARIGYGTIAVLVKTCPTKELFNKVIRILDELELMTSKQEAKNNYEIVTSTCLRINLNEVKKRMQHSIITQKDKDDIIVYCQNVVDAFMAVG